MNIGFSKRGVHDTLSYSIQLLVYLAKTLESLQFNKTFVLKITAL